MDYVTLGGCRQYDDYLMEVRENDSNGIWERTTTLVPSLKKAEIVFEAVGLRPFRTCIRVEKEEMEFGDRRELKVVHHYGHCGYGVMTSPGSAVTVSKLTGELLRGNPVNNHLLGAKL
jgi:glycine/D-amino acid oxidase-like deaminating enzyme